jgi:hypothetical protein
VDPTAPSVVETVQVSFHRGGDGNRACSAGAGVALLIRHSVAIAKCVNYESQICCNKTQELQELRPSASGVEKRLLGSCISWLKSLASIFRLSPLPASDISLGMNHLNVPRAITVLMPFQAVSEPSRSF